MGSRIFDIFVGQHHLENIEYLNISTSEVNEDLQIVGNECFKFKVLGKEKELNLLLIFMCPVMKDSKV
jgi:hypothetical protein